MSAAANYPVTAYNLGGIHSKLSTVAPNANLSVLKLSNATLSPAFAGSTTNYTASVANGVVSTTVSPTSADHLATIAVNGTAVTSGSPSGAITLSVGANTINVVVSAQDGVTTQTYTIKPVTRLSARGKRCLH